MGELLETLVRLGRYPLWVLVAAAAAWSLSAPFVGPLGQASAVLGALLGGLAGELLGRSRLRTPPLLALSALVAAGMWLLQVLLVGWWPVPAVLGPVLALHLSTMAGAGGGALLLAGTLRALGRRGAGGRAAELTVVAAAVASAFASHRGGNIARPLWLSDQAWALGLDPVAIILAVGVLLALALPLLMLLESRRRLPLVTAGLLLPLLVLIAFRWTRPADQELPPQVSELEDLQQDYGKSGGAGQEEHDEWENFGGGGDGSSTQDGGQQGQDQQNGGQDGEQPPPPPGQGRRGDGSGGGGQPQEDSGGAEAGDGEGGQGGEGGDDKQDIADPQQQLEEESSGQEPQPVAVVVLGDDYTSPSEAFYLRQEPHSEFNGVRLVKTTQAQFDPDALDHFAVAGESLWAPPEGHRDRVQGTVSMLVEHNAPFGLEAPVRFSPTRNPHPGRFVRTYAFESLAQRTPYEKLLGQEIGDPGWDVATWSHYTEGPADPRYRALADRLISELPLELRDDPFARALKIKLFLDEHMRYTRAARHAEAEDPTADFLFGDMVGYCVHSAHAATFLWRSVGIPSRIGTGYLVREEDRRGSALLVRNDQAHAWPELYLRDLGWVVLDIAPSENLDPPAAPLDEELLEALSDLAREASTPPPPDRPSVDLSWVWPLVVRLAQGLLGTLLTLTLAGHYAVKLWRRVRPLLAGPAEQPRVAFRAALDQLAEAGLVRAPGETRERFARRVADVAPSLQHLTALHLAAALDRPERRQAGADAEAWRTGVRALRRELRAGTPWWRRLLGLLSPFSFYRAR